VNVAELAAETTTEADPVTVLEADRQAMASVEIGLAVQTIITTLVSTILKRVEAAVGKAEKAEGAAAVDRVVAQAEAGVHTEFNAANSGFGFSL
jgi:hypothetical protein